MKTLGTKSQRERVLDMLRAGPMTTIDLHAKYVLNPACVIFRLRAEGHTIVNNPLPNGVANYVLVGEAASE